MQFVAGGPFRVKISSLCYHCTNRVHCTHINLKIVCSLCFCPWTPRSISPVPIQSAIVWMIIIIMECACRHSGIWYFDSVLYTNGSTYWTTNKGKATQLNKKLKQTKQNQTRIIDSSLFFTIARRRRIAQSTVFFNIREIPGCLWMHVEVLWIDFEDSRKSRTR